jgi:hypothetical protein
VDEQQTPEARQPRHGRALVIVISALAAATLLVAFLVVARSLRKVVPEPLPSGLKTAPPDTAFAVFRASTRHKVNALSIRCREKRQQLGDSMTSSQDSMSRECDSAIASLLYHIAAFDTVSRGGRKAAAESLTAEYGRAKLKVRVFTRSGLGGNEVSEDSLDQELRTLISE